MNKIRSRHCREQRIVHIRIDRPNKITLSISPSHFPYSFRNPPSFPKKGFNDDGTLKKSHVSTWGLLGPRGLSSSSLIIVSIPLHLVVKNAHRGVAISVSTNCFPAVIWTNCIEFQNCRGFPALVQPPLRTPRANQRTA